MSDLQHMSLIFLYIGDGGGMSLRLLPQLGGTNVTLQFTSLLILATQPAM